MLYTNNFSYITNIYVQCLCLYKSKYMFVCIFTTLLYIYKFNVFNIFTYIYCHRLVFLYLFFTYSFFMQFLQFIFFWTVWKYFYTYIWITRITWLHISFHWNIQYIETYMIIKMSWKERKSPGALRMYTHVLMCVCVCVVHISSPRPVWPFKLVENSLLSKINWRIDWAAQQTHYIDVGARASVYITYRMSKGRIMTSRFWFKHDKVQSTWKNGNHSLFTIISIYN